MYEFRNAKEHAIARTFRKAFRLVERCLLMGLMVAVSLEAQQSSPSAPAWTGVVHTTAGEPVAGAKVTVYTPGAKRTLTAVTGTDGRFAIADLRLGPNPVSVQLPGRGRTASTGVDITGTAVVLTVSDQNVLSIGANPQNPAAGTRMETRAQRRTRLAEQAGRNSMSDPSEPLISKLKRASCGATPPLISAVNTAPERVFPRMSAGTHQKRLRDNGFPT